jgi:hypothetical protein
MIWASWSLIRSTARITAIISRRRLFLAKALFGQVITTLPSEPAGSRPQGACCRCKQLRAAEETPTTPTKRWPHRSMDRRAAVAPEEITSPAASPVV